MKNSVLKWLWNVTGRIKISVLLLLIIQILTSSAAVCSAWIMKSLINSAVDRNKQDFICYTLIYAGIIVLQLTMAAFNRYLQEYSRSMTENCFKKRLFSCLMKKNYEDVTNVHSGEWMNRLTSDTVVIAEGVTVIVPEVSGMIVKLLGAAVSLIILIPNLVYIIIPGGIAMVVLTYSFRKKLKKLHKNIQEADGRLRVFMSERLSSLMVVKIFAKEGQTVEQSSEKMAEHKKARIKRNHFSNICNIGFGVVMRGVYAMGAIYCGWQILLGRMRYGTFTAVLQLIGQVQSPFANITGYLPKYYAMIASAERLIEAETLENDYKSEIIDFNKINSMYINDFKSIVFEDICFTYKAISETETKTEMPVVLNNLNLDIQKGCYVAFTGHSGCGKSTVLKLIVSLYKENSGRKYIRTKTGEINLDSSVRSLFAYVPQGNQLMSGKIREVIAFFDKEKMQDTEKINLALKIACADQFVSELKDGIDTLLGERGTGLSEGQMQRIAIARAVFADNPVLLLDEATSSLDETTERKVLENLRKMTNKTVIIVTHRPAALKICDKIINFENI